MKIIFSIFLIISIIACSKHVQNIGQNAIKSNQKNLLLSKSNKIKIYSNNDISNFVLKFWKSKSEMATEMKGIKCYGEYYFGTKLYKEFGLANGYEYAINDQPYYYIISYPIKILSISKMPHQKIRKLYGILYGPDTFDIFSVKIQVHELYSIGYNSLKKDSIKYSDRIEVEDTNNKLIIGDLSINYVLVYQSDYDKHPFFRPHEKVYK